MNRTLVKKESINMKEVKQSLSFIESEYETLKETVARNEEQKLCKICMDQQISMVFLPCGHLICCDQCAQTLKVCPMCRKQIEGTVKTYMS